MEIKNIYKEYQDKHADFYEIDKKDVVNIVYHEPRGEGDSHFVDVMFYNGDLKRIFKPDSITWGKKKEVE